MATALDANVLLRLSQKDHPLYRVCRNAAEKLWAENETLCFVPQNIVEFWNVLTRPASARGGFGLTPMQADRRARMLERIFLLLPDTPDVHTEWRRLVVEVGVSGVQVHDARIAACLRVHGVTRLLTFNTKDFARYSGFIAVDPAQI